MSARKRLAFDVSTHVFIVLSCMLLFPALSHPMISFENLIRIYNSEHEKQKKIEALDNFLKGYVAKIHSLESDLEELHQGELQALVLFFKRVSQDIKNMPGEDQKRLFFKCAKIDLIRKYCESALAEAEEKRLEAEAEKSGIV